MSEYLANLNQGTTQAKTLSEALAVDQAVLLSHAAPDVPAELLAQVEQQSSLGILKKMTLIGTLLHREYGAAGRKQFGQHRSDTVRGWACFMVGADKTLEPSELLSHIRPLADDGSFTVREWAWMGVRNQLTVDLEQSISLLSEWTVDPSERVRRFASEALRPRGVWASHIPILKQEPKHGLPLLEPLRSDSSKYVQDSVANWINDVSKTRPDWALSLCTRWQIESPTPQTERIAKRALRTLSKGIGKPE